MGILRQIQKNSIIARLEKNSVPQTEKKSQPPSTLCPACGNGHFWQDCYQKWSCFSCNSPRTQTMVREEHVIVAHNAVDMPPSFIRGVLLPDGETAFADDASQAERRGMLEDWNFWDRMDARKLRQPRQWRTAAWRQKGG